MINEKHSGRLCADNELEKAIGKRIVVYVPGHAPMIYFGKVVGESKDRKHWYMIRDGKTFRDRFNKDFCTVIDLSMWSDELLANIEDTIAEGMKLKQLLKTIST